MSSASRLQPKTMFPERGYVTRSQVHDKINLIGHLLVLTCPVDLNFPVEAEFVFSDFLLIPLAPGMNRKYIVHIFSISR